MAKGRPSYIGKSMKRWFFIGCLAIIGIFGVLGFLGENGALEIFRLKGLLANLRGEIHSLEVKQEDLKDEIAQLGEEHYVEFLAREQLGLMRPNEIFILIEPKPGQGNVDRNPSLRY